MKFALLLLAATSGMNLQGSWARLQTTTAVSKVPVLGDVEAKTTVLSLVRMEPEGPEFVLRERICAMRTVTAQGAVVTEYPQSFLRVASGERRAKVIRTRRGARYMEPRTERVFGASIEKNESVPSRADDPRVRDEDQDSQPGLTVKIRGLITGEIYVAQRGAQAARGRWIGKDRLVGQIRWSVDQQILGATRDVLRKPLKVEPHPSAKKNFFKMRRIASDLSCAQLKKRRTVLFGRN